jgi:hypothetical protein
MCEEHFLKSLHSPCVRREPDAGLTAELPTLPLILTLSFGPMTMGALGRASDGPVAGLDAEYCKKLHFDVVGPVERKIGTSGPIFSFGGVLKATEFKKIRARERIRRVRPSLRKGEPDSKCVNYRPDVRAMFLGN